MKKAALTIGLFSLAIVATSFTTSEIVTSNVSSNNYPTNSSIDPKGSHVGGDKKMDLHSSNDQSVINIKSLDFTNVNQSVGLNKKQD
ncbi:hypothetical protein [Pseudomonas shirazensis]